MRQLLVSSGLDAQNELAALVRTVKDADPFRHVTLVVESNHQALQFRRQLVRSLARTGHSASLISFSARTKLDLVSSLARIVQIEWDPQKLETARQETLRKVLVSQGEVFTNLADHPESFATIDSYTKQFEWTELSQHLIQTIKSASGSSVTKISLQLLQIAQETQERLRAEGQQSPADLIREIESLGTHALRQQIAKSLGHVVVLTEDYPGRLASMVDNLVGQDNHVRLVLHRGGLREQGSKVLSYPDPETEAKAVVREVSQKIAEGSAIEQMAVLYTDANQYSDILEHEFDQAQINWNGIATDSPALSKPAIAAKGYLAVVSALLQSGTFNRFALLSLLRTASITSSGKEIHAGPILRYLNKNGLFNEVNNWLPLLDSTVGQLPRLKGELDDLVSWKADQEEIDDKAYEIKQAEVAGSLAEVIRALEASAERLSKASKNSELATKVWDEINELFPQISLAKMPIDRLAYQKLGELFGSQPSSQLNSPSDVRRALSSMGQTVLLKLGQLKMQHGELARGVYVGPVSQNGALYFENLWIVGVGDGMLPQPISEDPVFPDVLKAHVSELTGLDLSTVSARVLEIEANFFGVATGAKNLAISYPRGGTLSKGEGMPSSWLAGLTTEIPEVIPAAMEFRLDGLGAVSIADLQSKVSAAQSHSADSWSKELSSAIWFESPTASEFAGNLSGHANMPLVDFEQVSLSASSVERFLKCGHNFFTTKLLGISDMDEVDEIDELRAMDFGKAVHASFERLLKEFPSLNPAFGDRYSDVAITQFAKIFMEECEMLVSKGQAGWAPLFESRKRSFLNLLDDYFKLEHDSRTSVLVPTSGGAVRYRLEPMKDQDFLRPQLAEFEFDKTGNGVLEVPVSSDNHPVQTLRFKGLIDRIDISATGEHVGIIDFKTGSKAGADENLAVQDLLYEYAIRHNTQFIGVQKVSSRYLYLSKKKIDSGLVDLRPYLNKEVFLDEANGGLTGADYTRALVQKQELAESELLRKLSLLVSASFEGNFFTHNTWLAKKSLDYCSTCIKLGKKAVARLSDLVNVGSGQAIEASDEEQD
jgi:RecB family exonuclease